MDIAGWKRVQRLLNIYQIVTFDIFYLAGDPGFEPRLTVLETAVLPLYYSPKKVGVFSGTHLYFVLELVNKLSYLTSTYCTTTLADCELETFVDSSRVDKLYSDSNVITRHYHFYALWK